MRMVLAVVLVLLPTIALPSEWNCRNEDTEIRCDSGKCEVIQEFTPLSINMDTEGAMTICAYSGCWKGAGKVFQDSDHVILSGHKLKWSGTNPGSADFIVAIDSRDNIGFLKGEGFAIPIVCKKKR
jgi:hypothetical protein